MKEYKQNLVSSISYLRNLYAQQVEIKERVEAIVKEQQFYFYIQKYNESMPIFIWYQLYNYFLPIVPVRIDTHR